VGTAQGLINAMRALIGTTEDLGENHNRLTDWFADRHGEQYRVCPWCDITVAYAAAQSDNVIATMGEFAWTVAHAGRFYDAGRWNAGMSGIKPGDVVFFDWSGTHTISKIDHVGVVEAVYSNGTVGTIEGNTDNQCLRRLRGPSVIAGYGRPAYEGPVTLLLDVDGEFGPMTKRALQRKLEVLADGIFGPVTKKALQRRLSVAADGIIGPVTVRALQRHVGANVDGVWGSQTTRKLQTALNVSIAKNCPF
jgi:peptidoglycan hydrolase-like protein with peptidoglycan-binding domain